MMKRRVDWSKVGAIGNIGLLVFNAVNTFINIMLYMSRNGNN